jgi:hypothetical protein
MICCKEERPGRYCSECGKPLQTSPLVDLLYHCRKTEKSHRSTAKSWGFDTQRDKAAPELVARYTRFADEWKARGDALAELLAAKEAHS